VIYLKVAGKALFFLILLLISGGCAEWAAKTGAIKDPKLAEEWLNADIRTGFQEALKADYTRLTIIAGSLNKLNSATSKERILGVALGAIEATTFPATYEYRRLSENENIPVEVKRELAPPGLLKVLNQNYLTLEHLYQNILKPLAETQELGKALTPKQQKVLDKAIEDINIITGSYRILSQDKPGPSREEIQQQINVITKAQNELEKMIF